VEVACGHQFRDLRAPSLLGCAARMLALFLAATLFAHASAHSTQSAEAHAEITARAAERHATMMRSLVKRGDPAAVAYVVRAVQEGLPPVALLSFLEAARRHPNPAYAEVLQALASYRSVRVRAWALLALAAIGEAEAHHAVTTAFGDADVRIRLLGLGMAETYTTPALEEASLRLLDRDPEVATIRAAAQHHGDR
jgi:hypothetical protein